MAETGQDSKAGVRTRLDQESSAVWNINNAWAELPEKLTRALDAKYQKAAKHGVAPHVEVVTAEAA